MSNIFYIKTNILYIVMCMGIVTMVYYSLVVGMELNLRVVRVGWQ